MGNRRLTRREFIGGAALLAGASAGAGLVFCEPSWLSKLLGTEPERASAQALSDIIKTAPRAKYWVSTATPALACTTCHSPADIKGNTSHRHDSVQIKCQLCAQQCLIAEGERGRCRARMNVKGELRSLVYGRPISVHVDPIEKKPFYHFLPGSRSFSLSTTGCPLRCKFCQNWQLSQAKPEDFSSEFISPTQMADQAASSHSPVIAFTYNEPTVFTEYLLDISQQAKRKGIRRVMISCGFMAEAPLTEMCQVLDAIKIDLKGFSDDFYRRVSGAQLKPVLRSIKQIHKSKTHLEIVNLVVPTLNDSDSLLKELAKWVAGELGPDVPVHFTRFHPDFQLTNLSPTPIATLERAREIALNHGIHYAFVGNVPGHPGNHTYCPKCGKIVIKREGFFVQEMHLTHGNCAYCQQPIAGVWA
jgi:pyruvate formate lyase activating enzyme